MSKIVHITSAHHFRDSRIFYKECRTLAAAGHDVVLVAPGAPLEVKSGVRFESVKKRASRRRRATITLFDLWRKAAAERADVYHFHDPELILVGLLLKARGYIVIYDVHEHLPNQIMEKTYLGPRSIRALLAYLVRGVERMAGYFLDGFCVAAPSIQTRFPSAKTVLLRNFVHLGLVDSVDAATTRPADERAVLIYPGSLSEARGIKNVIDAVGRLDGKVELWLFGKWHDADFEAACKRSDGWRFTRYFGRQSQEEVIAHVKAADAGIHLPPTSPNYSDGLAVKGFEFMACRIPFLTTDEPAKRRTFADCAVFTDATDVARIAESISDLVTNPELCAALGETGRMRVEEEFSWEVECKDLLALYERFTAERNRFAPTRLQ